MVHDGYSAGLVSRPFCFQEFKKMMKMLSEGISYQYIEKMNADDNIFSAPTPRRSKDIFLSSRRRSKALPDGMIPLFVSTNVAAQKIITLLAIMKTDRLLFDFIYEVYRDKIILGSNEISDADISIFFNNKLTSSELMQQWKEATLRRLGFAYMTILSEAGLIEIVKGKRIVKRPLLDPDLEKQLRENGMEHYINALTGV